MFVGANNSPMKEAILLFTEVRVLRTMFINFSFMVFDKSYVVYHDDMQILKSSRVKAMQTHCKIVSRLLVGLGLMPHNFLSIVLESNQPTWVCNPVYAQSTNDTYLRYYNISENIVNEEAAGFEPAELSPSSFQD